MRNCNDYLIPGLCKISNFVFFFQVNGVPVEVVHAVLFSRQSWVVLVVDLLAACSMRQY